MSDTAISKAIKFLAATRRDSEAETEIMARFAALGIGPHGTFDIRALTPEMRKAVLEGMADAWAEFKEFKETQLDTGKHTSADAFGTREFLKGRYLDRMSGAVLGIYGNSKAEAIYPVYFVDDAKKALPKPTHFVIGSKL